jgi:hypothetical protein
VILVGKPEERDHLGNSGVDEKNIIKMDLQEVGCGGMDWIELAQYMHRWRTLMNEGTNLRVP